MILLRASKNTVFNLTLEKDHLFLLLLKDVYSEMLLIAQRY